MYRDGVLLRRKFTGGQTTRVWDRLAATQDRDKSYADSYCQPSVDGLHFTMIRRFRHKGLESLFLTGSTKGIDAQLAAKLRRMLLRLNDGRCPDAMSLPGYRLHQLKGDRKGSWSVWVSGNYRLIFDIEGEDATNVDFEDYH